MAETQTWTPLSIGEREQRAFAEIMPPGRSLDALHVDMATGTLRITLDDGGEVMVPCRKN
jgi:hypothetical protein